MASITQQPPLEMERVAEMLLVAAVLTALAVVLLALMSTGLAAGARWMRHRRSSLAPGESVFVARWGPQGPELFVVGAGARRLLCLQGGTPGVARREFGEIGPALAARMLLELLGRRPARELVWAFAEERLSYLPVDGLVLPASEVVSWLDARHAAPSKLVGRAFAVAGASATLVTSRLRRAKRSTIEERVPGA